MDLIAKIAFIVWIILGSNFILNAGGPGIIVLEETGLVREGKPVLRVHRDGATKAEVLSKGWPGHMLRLYGFLQNYQEKRGEALPRPAYLLFSNNQGGFPRFGFYLENEYKSHDAYIDLHQGSVMTGAWGSVDQIFSHELGHILLKRMVSMDSKGLSNQVHAIGVRTDPKVAFDEGFAEHFQILTIDDPEAAPATRSLRVDASEYRRVQCVLKEYCQELTALFAPCGPRRMTLPFWFSHMENVMRYEGVKNNDFAWMPELPEKLLLNDINSCYYMENILPGVRDGKPKTMKQLMACEGVVAALFYRWATSPKLLNNYRETSFYDKFGVSPSSVTPVENYYLKLFYAMDVKKPKNIAEVAMAYKACFPDESDGIDAAIHDVFLKQALCVEASIWLANKDFMTGTSLFDQFVSLPRTHTFDLNGASDVDLMSVPGMTLRLARSIQEGSPFQKIEDLKLVPGMTVELFERFVSMKAEMDRMDINVEHMENSISFSAILLSYFRRMSIGWLMAASLGALISRALHGRSWWRCAVCGVGAATPGVLLGWFHGGLVLPWVVPALTWGSLGALYGVWRRKSFGSIFNGWMAWLAVTAPSILVTRAWF